MYPKIDSCCIQYILLAALLLLGCNNQESSVPQKEELPERIDTLENLTVFSPDREPPYKIEFIKEQIFTSPEDLSPFGRHDDIAIGDSGMVYIKNGVDIHIFDPEGNHITTMGGEGRGPGEHNSFGKKEMHIQSDRLFTYDNQSYRINIFSLETSKPGGTIDMDPTKWSDIRDEEEVYPGIEMLQVPMYYPFGDSLLLLRFTEPIPLKMNEWGRSNPNNEQYLIREFPAYYYVMNRGGDIVSDKIFEISYKLPIAGQMAGGSPLAIYSRSLMEVSTKGNIYTADTKNFLIKVHNSDGTFNRAFYYPFENLPVDQKKFINAYTERKKAREILQNSELPDTWPILSDMIVDDEDRIWVSTYAGNYKSSRWHLLDNSGKRLATFNWPANHFHQVAGKREEIRAVQNGYLYAYEETPGDEFTFPQGRFVRYRIEMN